MPELRFVALVKDVPTTAFFKPAVSIDAGEDGGLLMVALFRGRGRLHWLLCLNTGTFENPEWGIGVLEGVCSYDGEQVIRELLKHGGIHQFDRFVKLVLRAAVAHQPDEGKCQIRERLRRHGIRLW